MELSTQQDLLRPELYFLIQKFLSQSPLQETYKTLSKELEEKKILPVRLDWKGNSHERTFDDLERLYPHIGSDHILDICRRIGPILDREIPPCVKGVTSLLGSGRQSLLRTVKSSYNKNVQLYHATRRNGMPVCDPYLVNTAHNIANIMIGREMSGPVSRVIAIPPSRYNYLNLQRQTLGHLSAVYCLLFDHTGRYIVTGADDLLVKIWSAISGRLISSFRGASAEITDIDINLENTLLAAGSIDRILRVWDLQTGAPVAVLPSHTGMITSVHFCPSSRWDIRYLVTTSSDGSVAFWTYSHDAREKAQFVSRPVLYHERMRPGQAQMICASFSPGGTFLAAGSADHHVRVYLMRGDEGPLRVLETEVHSDRVDSIAWAHRGLRFISGSKDGTAFIWHFERQQWKSQKLCMNTKLPLAQSDHDDGKVKMFVTMVSWDYSDTFIITAVSDNSLKVWDSATGTLQRVLTGHTNGIYVLESHPKDPHVVLSTGHDGQIFIWDILRGTQVANFTNQLDNGQGCAAVFDAKWSPEGTMFAASDSHGHIMIFGFGNGNPQLKLLPKELFFHTDYRPLVRDAEHLVLDEQTQIPPHVMPPPFLVDIDGNPYPPMLQRLVPGREHCTSEQLVPNIIIGTGGRQEVIEGLPEDEIPRSDLDRLIAALAQRQYGIDNNEHVVDDSAMSPRSFRSGYRRLGDMEGVRQSTGDWQGDQNVVWSKNVLVQPLKRTQMEAERLMVETIGIFEMAEYHKEIKRRPLMINTASSTSIVSLEKNRRRRRNGAPTTRATSSNQEVGQDGEGENDEEENNSSTNNSDESSEKDDLSLSGSTSEDDESSGYSDWVADQGVNLEPPKRSKRRPAHHKIIYNDQHEPEDEEPLCSTSTANPTVSTKTKRIVAPKMTKVNGEVPEIYKALEWLSETIPRKAPYYPQMGDEVVYFIQGHQMYVNAVRLKKVYNVNNRDLPWTRHNLKDREFVKIVGIKYVIRPPRLCCLKLALLDEDHHLTGNVFTIKYHDMADVLDFFVLKQTYETAISRDWNIGDKFRCMIDDGWWVGKVVSKSDLAEEYRDSLFMCYEIQWDNGELERMSPWDLEPIREDRLPDSIGAAVPVLQDEIQAILYRPTIDEWPRGDRDTACRHIICGLDKVMELSIAEPFLAPVDFNIYPSYAYIVEYPLDLTTIKSRFENKFYRRITSAQFDVRYLATNAEKFNEPHSIIVKYARIITELCLRIIKDCTEDIDVSAIYRQYMDTYETSCSEGEEDVNVVKPGPSSKPNRSSRAPKTRSLRNFVDWRIEAKNLLDLMWKRNDSAPFRTPVDRIKHPDYYQMIDTPMDLATVREDLLGGNYETPIDFAKDMRLIFTNSKHYNTNKKSRIHSMTIRLSSTFNQSIKRIIYHWRRLQNEGNSIQGKRKSRRKIKPSTSSKNEYETESEDSEKENLDESYRKLNNNRASTSNIDSSRSTEDGAGTDNETKENCNASLANIGHSSCSNYSDRISNKKIRTKPTIGSNTSEDSSDSDYQPLSNYVEAGVATSSGTSKRKIKIVSSSDSNDVSDSSITNNLRLRNVKRPKRISDSSDSEDNLPLRRTVRRDSDESDEGNTRIVNISSRGRVRKLTEKARAILKK